MRVTLKDIADAAGVSIMTVSNVINGRHARVSAETTARIQRIVGQLGYVPNGQARSLAAQTSQLIGLLVPAGHGSLAITPHHAEFLGQAERQLRRHGYHLMLRGIAEPREVAEALRSWSLDGAILLGFLDEDIDRLDRRTIGSIPVLAIDSYSANPLTIGVRSDDVTGARLAAEHLLSLGHKNIVFAGPTVHNAGVVHERFLGFQQALHQAGIPDPAVETADTTHADGVTLGRRLLDTHPHATAVFATADILAIGIMEGLTEAGVPVPQRVSVVGFDNLDISSYTTPKLTTVAQDITGKAVEAVTRLLAIAENGEHPSAPAVLDVELISRMSTAAAAS
ncbi:LacI family DNA-binding transcriptional regulator [Kibdelosporangium persicum]|uniref:HTH-type transcriptional repressor PurR n=1 Tax=Kibdelosporangium persicum TaxID=2698649 RepID=A0ABX2F5H0_9PSEU|nr:LacI family DNA-binding transcriptional regulator [Kibdelosporangium persicum]NRN66502.1 HTH-type transcriptional repressor PurR [Kibdelosporangium persicum]